MLLDTILCVGADVLWYLIVVVVKVQVLRRIWLIHFS